MEAKLAELLEYVRSERRVCPTPQYWDRLWQMLRDRKRVAGGWDPPAPLILAAWYEPAELKMERLEEHIRYAAEHGALDEVDTYLRSLSTEQWFRLAA
jgi:hypothetical protein